MAERTGFGATPPLWLQIVDFVTFFIVYPTFQYQFQYQFSTTISLSTDRECSIENFRTCARQNKTCGWVSAHL